MIEVAERPKGHSNMENYYTAIQDDNMALTPDFEE